jgi:hypothetical protein
VGHRLVDHTVFLAQQNQRTDPAQRACAGFRKFSKKKTVDSLPPSRTLELLAFDEYCQFDTSAVFMRIKRGSLYTHKESRSIKTAIFIES